MRRSDTNAVYVDGHKFMTCFAFPKIRRTVALHRFDGQRVKLVISCVGLLGSISASRISSKASASERPQQSLALCSFFPDQGQQSSPSAPQPSNSPKAKPPLVLDGWPKYPLWDERSGMKRERNISTEEYVDPKYPLLKEVKGIVLEEMRIYGYPGCTFSIVRNGKEVYRLAAGLSDKDLKTPMQMGNKLRSASVEKAIISVLIYRLIQEKWKTNAGTPITLETKPFKVMYEEWGLKPIGGRTADSRFFDITIQQLLEHKSGIPDADQGWAIIDALNLRRAPTSREILSHLLTKSPSAPGAFRYSNTGYDVLRWFADYLTGDYVKAVREKLLEPAGAKSTDVVLSPTSPKDRDKLDVYYWADWKGPSMVPENFRQSVYGLEGATNTGGVGIPAFTSSGLALCGDTFQFYSPYLLYPASRENHPGTGMAVVVGGCGGTSALLVQGTYSGPVGPGSFSIAGLWNYCAEGRPEKYNGQKSTVLQKVMAIIRSMQWFPKTDDANN